MVNLFCVCGERDSIDLFLAECRETMLVEQRSDFVEAYFLFKIIGIYHV